MTILELELSAEDIQQATENRAKENYLDNICYECLLTVSISRQIKQPVSVATSSVFITKNRHDARNDIDYGKLDDRGYKLRIAFDGFPNSHIIQPGYKFGIILAGPK